MVDVDRVIAPILVGLVALAFAGGGYLAGVEHAQMQDDDSPRNITVHVPGHTHEQEPRTPTVRVNVTDVECGEIDWKDGRWCDARTTVHTSAEEAIVANNRGAAVSLEAGYVTALGADEGEKLTVYVVENGDVTPVKQIHLSGGEATVTAAEAGDGPLAEENDSRTSAGETDG
ncbi:hypothetical protein [Halopenitus persicus]|uniref:hypothetical protein n=1 Tax=Halopenitus persicus TaxID=1048396 RepID=UPI000BBABC56|nr:hypothetical protein [Halopenitus persicus]